MNVHGHLYYFISVIEDSKRAKERNEPTIVAILITLDSRDKDVIIITIAE